MTNNTKNQVLSELDAGADSCYLPARAALQWLLAHWPELLLQLRFAFTDVDRRGERFVDWELVGAALDGEGPHAGRLGHLSGGEWVGVTLATSLGCGRPVDLSELWRLDHRGHELLVSISKNRC